MEEELSNFIKVWLLVFISICYCHAIGKAISKGPLRLLFLLPIVCLFLYLPLKLSSLTFDGLTAFFIAWLANFKLLLFAFGKGPLASNSPSITLGRFVLVACLPIEIKHNQPPFEKPKESTYKENQYPSKSHLNGQTKETPSLKMPEKIRVSLLNYAIKVLLLALVLRVYDYKDFVHPKVLLALYGFNIYLFLELILALMAVLARALLGLELEPQFNEPYLSSSVQNFWGRRWNLMVSSILRQTVYEPTRNFSKSVIGPKWASIPGVMVTFMVSALMHELLFYYLGRLKPNWELTGFFVLHGFCVAVEIVLKKTMGRRWQLTKLVSRPLTIGFFVITSFWLFIPQLLRVKADVRILEGSAVVSAFLRNFIQSFLH